MILCFSDGVVEAHGAGMEMFGLERATEEFARSACSGSPGRVCQDLFDAVARHQGTAQQDDICIACMQFSPLKAE